MAHSFFQKLEQHPPVLCRLLAVHYPNGPKKWPVPLTDAEIQQGSGLTLAEIKFISQQTAWNEIVLWKIKAFIKGCRLKFENWGALKRISRLRNRGKFFYLRRDPAWEPTYRVLVEIWEKRNDR